MFDFAKKLKSYLQREFITDRKDWSIKGFIDAKKKIYPISLDTKLLSKILELTILPLLIDFCKKHQLEHYWRNYLRNEDAERMGIKRPYANLEEYFRWKERQQKRKR